MIREEVFVLGAGASSAHGAPLSNELLPYALSVAALDAHEKRQKVWLQLVREFLDKVFHVRPEVLQAQIKTEKDLRQMAGSYPGLVDTLSVVDMALDRRESLTHEYDEKRLRRVRESLEFIIYLALRHALSEKNPLGKSTDATRKLAKRCADPAQRAVISLNYDVLIDIELAGGDKWALDDNRLPLSYGLRFGNLEPPAQRSPCLLKLHGSFNWLHSSVSGNIYYGGLQKRIALLYEGEERRTEPMPAFAEERLADLRPILITPTHLKDLRNTHLATLWHQAGEMLRGARALTFVGYSMPGDDLHIKYLITLVSG